VFENAILLTQVITDPASGDEIEAKGENQESHLEFVTGGGEV
jgi:hypothetical protein